MYSQRLSMVTLWCTTALLFICGALLKNVSASNVCYLEQSGCKYRVTMLPTSCGQSSDDYWGDGGDGGDASHQNVTAGHTDDHHQGGNGFISGADTEASLKKLDALEQKLVKMMEELSVRSLRHIREIRSDLRHMSNSISDIKTAKKSSGAGVMGDMAAVRCPAEFVGVGTWRSCYRFSMFEASWHEAKEYCSAFGANLLTLETMKEAYIIDYLIKSNTEYEQSKGWWTNGQYVVRSQRWMWQGDKPPSKAIDFSRWAPGEPNARSTMHCMILYKPAKYFWHDATCTDKHSFICEINN